MKILSKKVFKMTVEKEVNEDFFKSLEGIQSELNGIKKKGFKQALQIILAIILSLIIGLGAGITCGRHWDDIMLKFFPNYYSTSTTNILEEKLTKQAKLNTGIYEQTSSYDSGKIYNNSMAKKLKINGKYIKFTYQGYVEAGIKDLSKVKVTINSKTNTITIDNLLIEITNVYIDPSSIRDAKQSKNIFNQITINDFTNAQEILEKQIVEDAKKSNIISTAQESAEEVLLRLFGDTVTGYDVVFNWK